ncbi:mannose-binding protein-like [Acanthopagrus latus]|uniref:mannose-binding protein-like n=1 Tax=Acanthopagrus latus TaxID=8177 RepID=UPI00187C161B|nr:mannose-binding protein-like [Acanthopagrus latus]
MAYGQPLDVLLVQKVTEGILGHLGDLEYLGFRAHLDIQAHQPYRPALQTCNSNVDSFNPGLFGETGQELQTLKERTAKLELAINYDFVRRVGRKYFVSYKERGSFSRAVDFCSQQGLELALPQNEEENNILTQFFGDVHKMAWISVNINKAEGNFETDMKDQPLTFTKWGAGQPDRSIGDTGCTMLSEHGVWRLTQECSLNAYIVCQL